jgi:polysaccharide transporter, PST family
MIKDLAVTYRRISSSIEYKNIFKNFGFLSLIQLGNYFLPLLSLPYLVNVLGADAFGQVMFAQAFVQYFITIIEYGFNFSATREISINRDNNKRVSVIFCSVMSIKIISFCLMLATLIVLVFTVERFSSFRSIYFLTFASVIGNILFPTWLFQGLEKMKYITFVNLATKIISTFSIFIFITKPDDFILVPLINAVASIVPSIISLFYLKKIYPIKIAMPSGMEMIRELKSGWFIFLSSVSTSLYGASNTFILGLLFNNTYAGYYSFAEKIIRAFISFLNPLNSALFPYMSLKMKESQTEGLKIFKVLFLSMLVITSIGVIFIYSTSGLIINFINSEFYPSIVILRILSPLLLIVAVSNLIGFQILYTVGLEGKFLLSVFIAGIINLSCCFLLGPSLLYKSAAIALLISETFICFSFLYFSRNFLFKKS